ncbi:hypothetical protein AAZX31_20G225000 [Glycine max]|uniref:Calmodulin-binding protein n=2 Tax=Glycine subgen. Soja TaxID=1462606 RepID=I1NJ51_SOYBN|nr:uncharacterized protein LOC100798350 [Glycine max]XP_028219734.1 uncharacterized protein LOC114401415 [Glycine soja]KAG4911297.1 hypothetical protein JHK87_057413 [Glycine soja]KAG4919884.1 hypothetical protein JHK85_058165 [Glycine max]KRG92954.1 hypothetical protein GLYMA_20G239500v4 [Glycine max]RZB45521.1 hypothetical protein D0Y65_055028 [Glycine soja]|eukprot:XP_003556537.1 uncharacterized protein LOC100798350 [Glycine max]
MEQLQTPTITHNNTNPETNNGESLFFQDFDSTCSTPYVSAPSSPGRGPLPGFFYSAPASPMHFAITAASSYEKTPSSAPMGFEFEFSARFGCSGSAGSGSMSSADELFLNGQIRPMKLSSHLERPQVLAPLLDLEGNEDEEDEEVVEEGVNVNVSVVRGRDLRLRDKSVRRRTRSMSPLRSNTPLEWAENEEDHDQNVTKPNKTNMISSSEAEKVEDGFGLETTPSASSSRSSSAGRSSKRWVFLKDFLRSKSEGRSNNKFWSTISFSPTKDKKNQNPPNTNKNVASSETTQKPKGSSSSQTWARRISGKPTNGVGKRRVPASPHELHYKANRAQAEELRKKTFLPYRQGLLGCLGFSSKGYGAINGFARALNPVSSR